MDSLPIELTEIIASYLSEKDYLAFASCSRGLRTYHRDMVEMVLAIKTKEIYDNQDTLQKVYTEKRYKRFLYVVKPNSSDDDVIRASKTRILKFEPVGRLYYFQIQHLLNFDWKHAENRILNILKCADIDPQNFEDTILIWFASEHSHLQILAWLLKDGRLDPSLQDDCTFLNAVHTNKAEIVELLLQDGRVNPAVSENYAIRIACALGYDKVLELLLRDSRVNPAALHNSPLRKAIRNGYIKIVDSLLRDPRVDPTADNNAALKKALKCFRFRVVKRLLKDKRIRLLDILKR
jgi:hypothetical protein